MLETTYYITQIIAVMAVVMSLIFVGVQIKQQRDDSRLASMRDVHKEWRDLMRYLIENPDINDLVWFKARRTGFETLTPEESLRVVQHTGIFVSYWQEAFQRHRQGRLDDAHFRVVEQKLSGLMEEEGGLVIWEVHKVDVTTEFRVYVNEVLQKTRAATHDELGRAREQVLRASGIVRADAEPKS